MREVIVHTGSKANTLIEIRNIWGEVPAWIPVLMSDIEQEDKVTDWSIAQVKCNLCGHVFNTILPSIVKHTDLECSNCSHFSCDIVIIDNEKTED